jgi:glutamyl-tRNA reductase
VDALRQGEIDRFLRKHRGRSIDRESINYLLLAMENKLLHAPIRNLKINPEGGKYSLKEALLLLFDIKEP